jgi:hypothetical protein
MHREHITVAEALERLKSGENLEGVTIDFKNVNVAYDPEFDDYEWERTDIDPLENLKERLTVSIEIDKEQNVWIQKNKIRGLGQMSGRDFVNL